VRACYVACDRAGVQPVQAIKKIQTDGNQSRARSDHFLVGDCNRSGADLNPATTSDNDTVGPEFVVKGDIVSVDGAPATGAFVCRGVIFTAQAPGPHGIAQVNVTWDVDGRGLLMGQSVEFRTGQPSGAVLGGTGEFERASGTYVPSGVPAPLGDGNFTFTFEVRQN